MKSIFQKLTNTSFFQDFKKSCKQIKNNNILADSERDEILKTHIKIDNNYTDAIVSQNFFRDLEIFNDYYNSETEDSEEIGSENNEQNTDLNPKTIFNIINYTKTSFGKKLLELILKSPTNNVKLLKNRQTHTKFMKKNMIPIGELLEQIKLVEDDIMWFWKEKPKAIRKMYDLLYFSSYLDFINIDPIIMQIYYYFKLIFSPIFSVLSPLTTLIFPYIITRFVYGLRVPFTAYLKLLKTYFISAKQSYYSIFSLALSIFMYFYNIYIIVELYLKDINILENMFKRCTNITHFLKVVQKLYITYNEDPYYLNYFKSTLKSNLQPTSKLIPNIGKLLVSYRELVDHKDKLIPIVNFIGNIDFYYSISKIFTKYDICYTNYIENSEEPIILAKNIYHPSLYDNCVNNSIKLGFNSPNNIIITGPNAGGKSTFIKSLSISVLLSHTLGISFGNKFMVTPFKFINSYLHIPDDKGTESLFEAQVNRCKEHIDMLQKLKKSEFSFIIMDEIFNSTSHDEGIASAYAILKSIGDYKNNISLITTHYKYLTKLSEFDNFINYFMPVKISKNSGDSSKEIEYTYKLKKGISNQIITFDVLKNKGFSKKILDTAKKERDKIMLS